MGTTSNIINGLIGVGVIIIFFSIGYYSNSYEGLIATMVGYSFMAAGFILMTGYLINNITYNNSNSILPYFITAGPFMVIIGVITYILYILGTYFNRIITGNVSSGYWTFTNIFIALIIAELGILYYGTQDKLFIETHSLPIVYGMLIYLLGMVSFIVAITLGIILAYYSTDG